MRRKAPTCLRPSRSPSPRSCANHHGNTLYETPGLFVPCITLSHRHDSLRRCDAADGASASFTVATPHRGNVAPDNKGSGQSDGDPSQNKGGQSAAANKPAAAKLAAAGDNTLLMLVPAIAILSIVLVVASKMHLSSRK